MCAQKENNPPQLYIKLRLTAKDIGYLDMCLPAHGMLFEAFHNKLVDVAAWEGFLPCSEVQDCDSILSG